MGSSDRRDFLTGMTALAGAAGLFAASERAAAGDPSFMNNVPDPLLADKELPPFTFALEKSKGRSRDGSYGKEATVEQLPISKGLAGVSMRLEPGVMRELHWHATAAEWAYVQSGRVRTTVVDPHGRTGIDDFGPGDIWYFPRGHGHMLQCLGNEPCHFILVFDNGYFSEFGTFSLTDWMGHVPPALLAKNLGVPAATFQGFPKEEVYFAKGPVPPEPPAKPLAGVHPPPLSHKHSLSSQEPRETFKGGREWRVEAKDFPISTTMTGVILELEPGALRELHWHPNADEWQYLLTGTIRATLFGSRGRYREATLETGDVGYIPQGYGHSLENIGAERAKILIVFNSGEYQTVDLSQWIAGQPADVLAVNFGKPAATFNSFPKKDVFMAEESHR
ncbi:MAG: cupin domain-containing protein [Planctomycetia bacterium]|jgi:oxalate decarboxylase